MFIKKIGIICLLLCAFSLQALEIPLLVKDGDLDIPLEGVTVSVQNLPQSHTLTDVNGFALVVIPDDAQFPVSIRCITPGYTDTEITFKNSSDSYTKGDPLVIVMGLDTVLEGDELVVEGARKGKTDEKPGVSMVRTSEEMKTTAQIGVVEDIMSSVSLLPGVGFKMGMNMEPSIRGGYPAEMGVTFDGVYLLEPFFWDGMVSILSPYMVDTVKLSTGIFSARYGQGTSGLLDTTSIKIDEKKISFNISTISADAAFELPLGDKNDLFLYAHLTDLTTVKWFLMGIIPIYDFFDNKEPKKDYFHEVKAMVLPSIVYMPHIYSVYGKWDFNPAPELSVSSNLLFAYDGMQIKLTQGGGDSIVYYEPGESERYLLYPPYCSITQFMYDDFQGLASTDLDWMVSNTSLLHMQLSYTNHASVKNNHQYDNTAISVGWLPVYDENGDLTYDEEGNVIVEYVQRYVNDDSFTTETSVKQQLQGRLFGELQITDNNIISLGIEEVFKTRKIETDIRKQEAYSQIIDDTIIPITGPEIKETVSIPGNNILNSCVFALWDFGSTTSVLQGEAGVRAEHYYLWNKKADFDLISYPVVNPRANIIFTPFRNTGIFDTVSFSAGSGLYSSLSRGASEIQKSAVTDAFILTPDTSWTSVIGSDLSFSAGVHITLEGYYKQYLSRTYVYADERDGQNIQYHAGNDGKGFATGADVMIEKSINGWLDGYISYSFLYARFYNLSSPQYDSQRTTTGDPLGRWYYPEYHRFHAVNAVLNFRLPKNCTLTLTGSFATGNPRKQYIYKGDEFLAGTYYDPGLNEYMYLTLYSDSARNLPDWPVDIRFSKSGTFKNPKHTWEWYVGIENVTGFPYAFYKRDYYTEADGFFDSTGWTIGEGIYTIDMGVFPLPSFGVKMTF